MDEEKKFPKVGVCAIVIKDGKILLGKRKGGHAEGTWGFTGGHLEFGETLEECVKREAMEETGIKIKNLKLSAITNDIFDYGKHYVTIYFVADLASGTPKIAEPDRFHEWKWFEWNALPKPLFFPITNLLKQKFDPFKFNDHGK